MKAYTKLCKQVCPKLGTNYKVIKYLIVQVKNMEKEKDTLKKKRKKRKKRNIKKKIHNEN